MAVTAFNPAAHGFHFSNNDITWSLLIFKSKFLCGGMVYAALDYFHTHMTIPVTRTAPAEGTTLHNYIFDRQNAAHVNTGGRFVGSWVPIVGLFVNKLSMNLEAEHTKLRSILRRGIPIPLCMVGHGFGHHVLAIGCSDAGPMAISVYDPNVPDKTATVTQRAEFDLRISVSTKAYHSLFVDDGYQRKSPPVLAGQASWRWCRKCQGLFFAGNTTRGVCPKSGAHDVVGSGNYVLSIHQGHGQSNWRWCFKCEGLYFAGHPNSAGICPDGGIHNGATSGNYFLAQNTGAGQQNWRWCQMCEGLFFAGNNSLGVCPANPNGHDGSRSGNYFLPMFHG
jgi:hypothetical protein